MRAVAVLSVVFYHANLTVFSGGFVGVDIFFVISGYVIAGSLLSDLRNERFSILNFYVRRIRRIFPALFTTFAVCWGAAWFLLLPIHFEDFSKSLLASATFVSNFYFWMSSGYFGSASELQPLRHTWSLSIEEQFYVFIPVVILLIHRLLRGRWFLALLPVIAASFALSVFASNYAPSANFFLLPTRAWELLLGVVLAVFPRPALPRPVAEAMSVAGMGLITFAVLVYSEQTVFPGASALAPCLGAALLIYAGSHQGSAINRALSIAPLVWIGLISYSLYLIHWPIIVFFRYVALRDPTTYDGISIVTISIVLAALSWRFVEQPFRGSKIPIPTVKVFITGFSAISIAMALGAAGIFWHGAPWRFPDFVSVAHGPTNWGWRTCFLLEHQNPRIWNPKSCMLATGRAQTALLWGDSFAAHYGPGIRANAPMLTANILQYTAAGCPPILSFYSYKIPRCQEFNNYALEIIQRHKIRVVILAARWSNIESRQLGMISSTISVLKEAGVEIWLIGQSVEFATDPQIINYQKHRDTQGTADWPMAISHDINERLRHVSEGARLIDPLSYLCKNSLCIYRDHRKFLYRDYGHFTLAGSARAVRAYFPLVRRDTKTVDNFASSPPAPPPVER